MKRKTIPTTSKGDVIKFCWVYGYPCFSGRCICRVGEKLSFCGREVGGLWRPSITWEVLWGDPPNHACSTCRDVYYFKIPQVTELVPLKPAVSFVFTPRPLDKIPSSKRP